MAETSEKKESGGFFKGLKTEFKKIIWPSRQSVVKQIVLIIVVTLILSVLVSLFDSAITWIIGQLAG